MNTALLRLAQRHRDGTRRWAVPGAPHAVTLTPSHRSFWNAPSLSWPALDSNGFWHRKGVRLDWHRSIAKPEIRKLIASCAAPT